MEQKFRSFLHQKSNFFNSSAKLALTGLSKVFQGAVALRNQAYKRNILPSERPEGTFIISIGNIQAGGTGKTPFTIFLAKQIESLGKNAILTRGYRAKEKTPQPFIANEMKVLDTAYTGDEPALLTQKLPDSLIIIGKKRLESAKLAKSKGRKIIILDDGFQHLSLKRDVDVVLIDASTHPEEMFLFPRGLLREGLQALSRAHLVVINRAKTPQHYAELKNKLSTYTNAPIVGISLSLTGILGDYATITQGLNHRKGALFCGIANPKSFVDTVENLNVDIVTRHLFDDHADYTRQGLYEIALQAKNHGAEFLICTEKDAVKISSWVSELPLPVVWTHTDMQVIHDKDTWNSWLTELKNKVKGCI